MTTAVMIGATGLVGSHLLDKLLADGRVEKVISLGRRRTGKASSKLEEHVVDFDNPAGWALLVRGDVAFSALGTTSRQVKSQAEQRTVDYQYQFEFARAAAQAGVPALVLCSSSSANPRSPLFYSRLKGELDRDVQTLGFSRVRILQPNILEGEREKSRPGEKMAVAVLGFVNALGLAKRHRATPGEVVARAMLHCGFDATPGTRTIAQDEVFTEAEK